jgi:hypothetical protein
MHFWMRMEKEKKRGKQGKGWGEKGREGKARQG